MADANEAEIKPFIALATRFEEAGVRRSVRSGAVIG